MKIENVNYQILPTSLYSKLNFNFKLKVIDEKNHFYLAAIYESEIIGFLSIRISNNTYVIHKFYVEPIFRDMGVGTNLLNKLIEMGKNNGIKIINAKYESQNCQMEKIASFFCNRGWGNPKYEGTNYQINKELFHKKFINKFFFNNPISFKKDIFFRFLNTINQEKKNEIEQISILKVPEHLFPLSNFESIVCELSIFAFNSDELVAWSIAELKQYNEISIKSTFVEPEFRHFGLGLYLWKLIFDQAKRSNNYNHIKWVSFDFDRNDHRNFKLYSSLFSPYVERQSESFVSQIKL